MFEGILLATYQLEGVNQKSSKSGTALSSNLPS